MTTIAKTDAANGSKPASDRKKGSELALAQRLLKVAGLIPEIDKDGHNDFQGYDFASAENVLRKVREPLAEEGILLLSDLIEVTERDTKTPKGKDTTITTVRVKFTFIDTKNGQRLEATWAGTGDDPSDKGIYKAYTGCVKTFLRATFLLPLGDDPEADTRADERAAEEPGPNAPEIAVIDGEQVAKLSDLAHGYVDAGEDDADKTKRRRKIAQLLSSEGAQGKTISERISSLTPGAADKVTLKLEEWSARSEVSA